MPLVVTFDAAASADSDGSIANYRWEFGDDATGSGRTVEHTYADTGRFTVRLTVTDDRGARATSEQDIQVQSISLLSPVKTADCGELYSGLRDATVDGYVALVRGGDLSCIWELRRISDPPLQILISSERSVAAIAYAVRQMMENYDGSSADGMRQALYYLVTAEYVHYWCLLQRSCEGEEWSNAASYSALPGTLVYEAVRSAVDSFVEHPQFLGYGIRHALSLAELAQVIDVYELHEVYLDVVTRWLNAWDDRHASISVYHHAMGFVLKIIRRGHLRSDFGPRFGEDSDLINAFRDFALDERWLGTTSQWIMGRSALELGRYSKYPGTTNYDNVLPIIESMRDAYANDDRGKDVWLRLVAEIDYNEPRNCARYALCSWYDGEGFNANFRAALFDETLECPRNACPADSISILAQDLQQSEMELACRRLDSHSSDFRAMFDTNCTPVRDDTNDHVDMHVFKDGATCEDLQAAAFGRAADDACNGIYFEHEPSNRNTVPWLVVTEYTIDEHPPDPELAIWNFEHEFAHYLDGRYNRYGGYREDDDIHWWVEGFAEYFAAETTPYIELPAFQTPYSLTDTLLHSVSLSISYDHRHLAARYLLENHRGFVDELLGFMRRGEYGAYTTHLESEAPKYEQGFRQWLSQGLVLKQVDGLSVLPSIGLAVSWDWVVGAGGYKVQWKSGSEDFDPAHEHVVNNRASTSYTIPDLAVGTRYAVRVIASGVDVDDGPPSDVESAAPILAAPQLVPGGDTASIDLPTLFTGLDNSGLTYAARSSDTSLVSVAVVAGELQVTSNAQGTTGVATITVTAVHSDGWTAVRTFAVAIETN